MVLCAGEAYGHQVVTPSAVASTLATCEGSLTPRALVGGSRRHGRIRPQARLDCVGWPSGAHFAAMKIPLDRREFLQRTGILTGALVAGSPLALMAPSRSWALDLTCLTTEEGLTLMAAARTIAPHDKLEDAAYAFVVRALDLAAAKDETVRKQLQDGVKSLGTAFAAAPEGARVEALRRVEAGAFFQSLRIETLRVLYSTPLAYAYFGYEGEAFSKGGYLLRGFNDLRWLPEIPEADSG